MVTYVICERTQKSRGSSANKFGGPDKYVAIQVVPEGVLPLRVMNKAAAKHRGITLVRVGEGYSKNKGEKSSYWKAWQAAETECLKRGACPSEIIQEDSWTYTRKFHPDDPALVESDNNRRAKGLALLD